MPVVGADIEQLRTAARTFRQKADLLESSITRALSQQIATNPWKGRDAEGFRHQWQADLAPKLRQVVAELRKSADVLTRNANEQERASARSGTPAGGGAATSGASNQGGRDYLQEVSDALGWTKVPSFLWDATGKTVEAINKVREAYNVNPGKASESLITIKGSGIIGGVFKGLGVIGSANDLKNFGKALAGGTDYDKLSTGVDALGGLLQHAPFFSPAHMVGTTLKAAKTIKEEVDKAVNNGPWPKGVSVFDAMAACTGEKPAKDFVGRTEQVIRGGAINFGKSVLTAIGKLF